MSDEEQTGANRRRRRGDHANSSVHHAEQQDTDWSEDPLLKPMQVLEWWDKTQVRVVLQQKCVIRNGKHKLPEKPFFSANYWDVEASGYGMGVGRISGADQRVEQGMINAILDILAFAVQPEYAIARGANVPTQDQRRRLGGIRMVDGTDASKAVALVPQPRVPPDGWRAIQAVVGSSEGATGADQATVQGVLPDAAARALRHRRRMLKPRRQVDCKAPSNDSSTVFFALLKFPLSDGEGADADSGNPRPHRRAQQRPCCGLWRLHGDQR
jgi:hypothetical protein